jgi:hypothetical protein
MDPILLLVLVVFVLLVLFAVAQRIQKNGDTPGEPIIADDAFDFEEDTENISPTVRRKTRIVAPVQSAGGGKRKLTIRPMPLQNLTGVTPPPEKGIDAILVTVLNPSARFVDSETEVYNFDPPLTLMVSYKPEDQAATSSQNGTPQLSLATVYQSEKGWRFERLPTTVRPNSTNEGGTLIASLKTLQPNDPVVMCRP